MPTALTSGQPPIADSTRDGWSRGTAYLGVVTSVVSGVALALLATMDPRALVPYGLGFRWLGGALSGHRATLTPTLFSVLLLAMLAGYGAVILWGRDVPLAPALAAVALLDLAFALTPPLLSSDVVGYVAYARLGFHGVDPYLHGTALITHDRIAHFAKWRSTPTAYGPLFTAATSLLGGLGLTAALWVFKLLAGTAAFAIGLLTVLTARQLSHDPTRALLIVGLNPVLLVYGIGGAHNDFIAVLAMAVGMYALAQGRQARSAVMFVVSCAIKAPAALIIPFALVGTRPRRRLVLGLVAGLAIAFVLSLALFGAGGIAGYTRGLHNEATHASPHSFPGWLGRHLGISGSERLSPFLREVGITILLGAVAALLVLTARGLNWISAAGWATLALLLTTTWLVPWYVVWLLPLTALSASRRLPWAALAFTAWIVLVQLPLGLG